MPVCYDQNGDNLHDEDDVIIRGKIKSVTAGTPCTMAVEFTQNGVTIQETFKSTDLIKAEIDGDTIQGQLVGPG